MMIGPLYLRIEQSLSRSTALQLSASGVQPVTGDLLLISCCFQASQIEFHLRILPRGARCELRKLLSRGRLETIGRIVRRVINESRNGGILELLVVMVRRDLEDIPMVMRT